MSLRVVSLLAVAVLASATATRPARADDADRCATRAEQAQKSRLAGRLRSAREDLIACANDTCPRAVRTDCARWLSEVESELPTVVVRAVDARGHDVTDVRVFVDGTKIADRVDGRPLAVDVGERAFRFERPGTPAVSARIVVRSGEHGRVVSATFDDGADASRPGAPSRVGPLVLGGVGVALAVTGVVLWAVGSGEHDDLASSCAPTGTCATSDVDAARTKLIVGDVAMLTGVLAMAGAVVWYIVAPGAASSEPARARGVPLITGPLRF